MMTPSPFADSPEDLIQRARLGDQDAWQILFDDCYPKVVRVVRRKISRPMRRIFDSTDIANDVMKSLAAKFDRVDFSSIDGLQAFLIHAAEQKVVDGYRRSHARKRDLSRDRPMYGPDGAVAREALDRSPTASQVAVASEQEQILLEGQEGERRAILEAKARGSSNAEVSRETGWHLRRVERFLERVRGTLRI